MIDRTTPLLESKDIFKLNSNPLEEILKTVDVNRFPETGKINKEKFMKDSLEYFNNVKTPPEDSKKIKQLKKSHI